VEPFQELEQRWAKFNGLNPAGMVACSSGTAALHLSLEALRLPPGSEVIVPALTMIACPRAVTLAGLSPVFVDCDEDLLMTEESIYEGIGGGVADYWSVLAVMPVHIYGRRCNMDAIHECARRFNLRVIEDLAEAHGVRPHPGTDAACWSFYRNKIVAGEEGGAVWFHDPEHAKLARSLRSLGFTDVHDFTHVPRGHNYRMSNAHAELILDSLDKFDGNWAGRGLVEEDCDGECPEEWKMRRRDAPWVYDLRIKGMLATTQDRVVAALKAEGIAARHCFKPMHAMEEYKGCRRVGGDVADVMSREVVYLPLNLDREQVRRAFEVIKRTL
jgi:dTDP-4-amino-4,6-dideoxygalactose transaminase